MAKKGPRVLVKIRSTESSHMYLTERTGAMIRRG